MKKHSDCKNFTAFDVFKGYCRRAKGFVLIDAPTCPSFAEAPKCRNCCHFNNPNEDEIGSCTGMDKEFWAYGDMNAKTCESYGVK